MKLSVNAKSFFIMHSVNAKVDKAKYVFDIKTPDGSTQQRNASSSASKLCLTTPVFRIKSHSECPSSSSYLQQSISKTKRSLMTPSRSSVLSSSRGPFHTATPYRVDSSNIVAIVEGRGLAKGEIGMAAINLKGSELSLFQIILPSTTCENGNMAALFDMIRDKYPNTNLSTVQRRYFNEASGIQYVKDLCAVDYKTVELAVKSKYYCLATASALLKYVECIQNIVFAPNSLKIVFKGSENTTMIDATVAKHLELVQNLKDARSQHSLYGLLNSTRTPGGARLLRANILQPPCDIETINIRFSCIEELLSNEDLFLNLQNILSKFLDVEHLISMCIQIPKREDAKTAEMKITEIIHLKHTLELVEQLRIIIQKGSNPLFITYFRALADSRFTLLLEMMQAVINDDTMIQKGTLNMRTQKVFLVKPGVNGMLDVVRKVYTECIDDIAEMIKQLANRHSLNLKPTYSTSRGFFIQVCDNLSKTSLPESFIKVVKTKSSLTCTTEDLIKMNGRVSEALNEIYILTNIITEDGLLAGAEIQRVLLNSTIKVTSELMVSVREHIGCMHKLAEGVSIIDMMVSFAHSCTISNYVRPEFTDTLAIKQGRHPILEKVSPHKVMVPNDSFASDANNFIIITGPNMSGKSTYLKQVVLLQVMAQVGSFVPAEYASLRLADQIFARVGTDDDIETNCSTFSLELKEINYIIKNATDKSLVIIDELGRGTSIDEGVGVCHSICEHFLQLKAFTFFATHFMELCQLDVLYPNAENYHMEVQTSHGGKKSMAFSHIVSKGKTQQVNYGICLAEMSSLPRSVIDEALECSNHIQHREKRVQDNASKYAHRRKAIFQLGTRLLQVARYSKLDEAALQVYLKGLKRQFMEAVVQNDV